MNKIVLFNSIKIALATTSLFFYSCGNFNLDGSIKGSGKTTTDVRAVNQKFENLMVTNGIKVIIEQSNSLSIKVEADDNIIDQIETRIENNKLIIESNENYSSSIQPIVYVKMNTITSLNADSGSQIESSNILKTEKLMVNCSSGSQINLSVEADSLSLESSEGSSITAKGKALIAETLSSSGSNIIAKDLFANTIKANASSGSSTSVYPIVKLDAKSSSGSSIDYYNAPKELIKYESSGGSISKN